MNTTPTSLRLTTRTRRIAHGTWALLAFPAIAQVHQGDIILDTSLGSIRTGAFTDGAFDERSIFLTRLGENSPNVSSDPGFDCIPGSFPLGSRNGLTLVGPLQEWNGSALEPSDAEYLRVEYLTLATDGPGPSAEPFAEVDTFTISVQANGQWHRHVRWVLRDGPEIGVYAQRMRVRSDSPAVRPSDDFYLLINQGGAPQPVIDAASAWIEASLAGTGDCPPCAADFDNNGGVDGGDLGAFFAAFETGDPCADIDANGGVDGGDLGAFFAAFESGGC